jgi:hypothetical protein
VGWVGECPTQPDCLHGATGRERKGLAQPDEGVEPVACLSYTEHMKTLKPKYIDDDAASFCPWRRASSFSRTFTT